MKHLIKPFFRTIQWVGIILYIFMKLWLFMLHMILSIVWDLDVKKAFTDAHTEYFAVFYRQTDEYLTYINQSYDTKERTWYYRTISDYFNHKKTYENK